MRLMIASYVRSGGPRQLIEMNERSRCSILFHLVVSGGKWHVDREVELVGDPLQLGLPHARAVTVA